MADSDILRSDWLHLIVSLSDDFILRVVQVFVTGPSGDVVNSLFGHGDEQHKGQRRYIREQKSDLEEWNKLREGNAEEEEVEEELELIDQHYRDECDDVVLLVVQPVSWEGCRQGVARAFQFSFLNIVSKAD